MLQKMQAVHLESASFPVCLNHALSTEKEGVMDLRMGDLNGDVQRDSKFAYSGSEMHTVTEKDGHHQNCSHPFCRCLATF